MSAMPWTRCVSHVSKKKLEERHLKVGSELFYNSFPSNKTFGDDICRVQVLQSDILVYKRLIATREKV